jgi:lipopolysaccharide transport system permease protein
MFAVVVCFHDSQGDEVHLPVMLNPKEQQKALKEVVYNAESVVANPAQLVSDIFAEIIAFRGLIWILFLRDLKAQFRQSYLGYIWLFLPPVLTTGVWLFLNSQKVMVVAETNIPYPLFVIIGSVVWQTFVKLIQAPMASFEQGRPVFMKLKVPPMAFIAAGTARALFDFAIYAAVLIPVFIVFRTMPPWTVLLLPIVVLSMVSMGTVIGLLLAPFGSLYTDLKIAVPIVLSFLMYLAPVVYPPPQSGLAGVVVAYNPMTPILMCTRDLLTTGALDFLPSTVVILVCSGLLSVMGIVGLKVTMPHLVARMGM